LRNWGTQSNMKSIQQHSAVNETNSDSLSGNAGTGRLDVDGLVTS